MGVVRDMFLLLDDLDISYAKHGSDTAIVAGAASDYLIRGDEYGGGFIVTREGRYGSEPVAELRDIMDLEDFLMEEGF